MYMYVYMCIFEVYMCSVCLRYRWVYICCGYEVCVWSEMDVCVRGICM